MMSGQLAILALYAPVLPAWVALSLWTGRRSGAWATTPRWHRLAAPAFRTVFLLTLPIEVFVADRGFIVAVFAIGTVATLAWLAARALYLARAPAALPREHALPYNVAYTANLMAFALACHSFACLAVMVNVSLLMLLVRWRHESGGPGTSVLGDTQRG